MADVAVVVGAGIGGLATAVALHRRGWSVTVLERAPTLEPVGAGIALAPNALRALDALGLADAVRGRASLQGTVGLRRPDGTWLVRADASAAADRFGESTVVLHRGDLVDLLVGALPDGTVRTGIAAVLVEPGGPNRPAVVSTVHEELTADLVVASDGIDSSIRAASFPDHPGPQYAGVTAWRFVAPAPAALEPAETWGRGELVGLSPLADGRVYCYATATLPEGTRFPDDAAELRRRFGDWHDPIPALLRDLDPATVLHHDLRWLATPVRRFDIGRVALLGDAAHAMTPHLGQGGCLALEDAVVLAAALDHAPFGDEHTPDPSRPHAVDRAAYVPAALAAYSATRLPRVQHVARMSAQVGAPTRWRTPAAVTARDLGLRTIGRLAAPMMLRRMSGVVGWRPPA